MLLSRFSLWYYVIRVRRANGQQGIVFDVTGNQSYAPKGSYHGSLLRSPIFQYYILDDLFIIIL